MAHPSLHSYCFYMAYQGSCPVWRSQVILLHTLLALTYLGSQLKHLSLSPFAGSWPSCLFLGIASR